MHPSEGPRQLHRPKCVLVLEPDALICELLRDVLDEAGFGVQTVSQAAAALATLGRQPPDVLLVDLAEPGLAGWTFLERCRQQPGCQTLPIAVMSATLAQHAASAAVRARGYGWLPKPFELDHLVTVLDDLTGAPDPPNSSLPAAEPSTLSASYAPGPEPPRFEPGAGSPPRPPRRLGWPAALMRQPERDPSQLSFSLLQSAAGARATI